MPCGTSLPPDELRAPCACSASAPSPRSQDGLSRDLAHCVRPHDAVADPCTGQPIDGAPPLVTMTIAMMTVPPSVRHAEFLAAPSEPRAPAWSVREAEALAVLSDPRAPSPSVRLAQLFAPPSARRAAPSSSAADQPSALRTLTLFLPQCKWAGPDRFYIEPVSRSTLARFGSHTLRSRLPAEEWNRHE